MNKINRKEYYDQKPRSAKISTGARVLVKKLVFEGKHKITDKFESEICIALEQPRSDIPVYTVKSKDSGRVQTFRSNHLLLVDHQSNNQIQAYSVLSEIHLFTSYTWKMCADRRTERQE